MRKGILFFVTVLALLAGCAGPFKFKFAVNEAPWANNDIAITDEDLPGTFDILANDTDDDGAIDPTTVVVTQMPSHGLVRINPENAMITYDPFKDFTGVDTFHYTVKDKKGIVSNDAIVTVTVNSINDAPVAVDDAALTKEEAVTDIDVLANDWDKDGSIDPTMVVITEKPLHGSATVDSITGMIVYTPNEDFFGQDVLKYTTKDDHWATSNVAEVRIAVESINDSPIAKHDVAVAKQGLPVIVDVLINDVDKDGKIEPSTVEITRRPSHGSWSVDSDTGAVTYRPNKDFVGKDIFEYTVTDNAGASSRPGHVTVTVRRVNKPPLVLDDVAVTDKNVPIMIDVLANDSDTDGSIDPTMVIITEKPLHGTAKVDLSTGMIAYTPNENFFGKEELKYTIKDGQGVVSNLAKVTITVNDRNQYPIALNDTADTDKNVSVVIDVLANDKDDDGYIAKQTLTIAGKPTHGSAVIDSKTSKVTYSPDAEFTGKDSFQYQVNDDSGAPSNFAKVDISINEVPVAEPVLQADPKQILIKADEARGNLEGVRWDVSIDTKDRKRILNRFYNVSARGFDILADCHSPAKDKGNKILMVNGNMWFYKPGLTKAIPISRRQKLMGSAAYGDIAATNYDEDYSATLLGEEAVDGEMCYVYDLRAATNEATYDRIKYWISKNRIVGIKAEYYTVSGISFKSATIKYDNRVLIDGKKRPFISELNIHDNLMVNNYTKLTFIEPTIGNIPDRIFNINLLIK